MTRRRLVPFAIVAVAALAAFGAAVRPAGAARAVSAVNGCGVNPAPPRDPSDPAIVVASPQSGATVSSPLIVSGTARVFEAVVSLALLAPGGDLVAGNGVIAQGSTVADAGAPAVGSFSGSLPFAVAAPTDACLLFYEASARDGSPQNVVQAPVRLLPSTAAGASDAGTPLRQVDWASVLANDSSGYLTEITDCPVPPVSAAPAYPCISATPTLSAIVPGLGGEQIGGPFSGYALIDQVIYGDIDGDGLEEAVIPTDSYGTGGSFGFLVYHQAAGAPQLVAAVPGYKVVPAIEDGRLVARQPFYFGFEANCCPTGVITTSYVDAGNILTPDGSSYALLSPDGAEQPVNAAEMLVGGYYRAIGERHLADAYAMLGPAMQAAQSYDQFVAGFSTTQSVSVTLMAGDSDDTVDVTLTSVDLGPDGHILTRTFAGTWTVGLRAGYVPSPYGVTPYDLELDAATIVPTS